MTNKNKNMFGNYIKRSKKAFIGDFPNNLSMIFNYFPTFTSEALELFAWWKE